MAALTLSMLCILLCFSGQASVGKYSLGWGKISNLHLLFLTQIPQNFSSPAPCVARATASTHIRAVYVSILARIGSPSSNLRLLAIFGGVCWQTFWEGGPNPKFPNFDVSILHRDRRSKEENHVRWRDLMPSGHRQGSEGNGEPHGAGGGQR